MLSFKYTNQEMETRSGKRKKQGKKITPLMQQYNKVKGKYPDAILLFRVGDFYETFGEDAVKTSRVLGIVLTSRNNGGSDIELAGFPHHSLELYLPRLVKAGFRVAICEQLEPPSKTKKIVKRGVTEMITPGLVLDESLLNHKENNYLAVIHANTKGSFGMAFLDISTGEFYLAEGNQGHLDKLLQSFQPSEIILAKSFKDRFEKLFGDKYYVYTLDDWIFTAEFTIEKLLDQFEVSTLKGFGVDDLHLAQISAGAALHYLGTTENHKLAHLHALKRIQTQEFVWLDRFTIRNLELIRSQHDTGIPLIHVLDQTISPMGARCLKRWLLFPLVSIDAIQKRLDIVEFFQKQEFLSDKLSQEIKKIGDLERLAGKISVGKVNPRELIQLLKGLDAIESMQVTLLECDSKQLNIYGEKLQRCESIKEEIRKTIHAEPPTLLSKGNVIAEGISEELDDLRSVIKNSKELLVDIQQEEAKATGISNLKIGFNSVFGYYLEVTNKYKNQGLIPDHWVRKQTLTNSERYISDELKKLEHKILGAEDKIQLLEEAIYQRLLQSLLEFVPPIQSNASLVAEIDCLLSFNMIARSNDYCKPVMHKGTAIQIEAGRHPVIEKHLPLGEPYIANDIYLDNEDQQILMITGPNMSGKSAILRQTALTCLMAQMGSFVPAKSAKLGIVDKIYTRVGASDNISSGESTFMVEMNETANILNNLSDRSLILLDEIGRGTSTYDGVSIAWAIAEYLHENSIGHPKTLFATHYHELNDLAEQYSRIHNFNVAVKEVGNKIVFLRKLQPGGSSHSFGIHVAKMAGMPRPVVMRAAAILKQLEQRAHPQELSKPAEKDMPMQLSIFETVDETAGLLRKLILESDIPNMTPLQCMMKLNELRELLEKEDQ